MIMNYRNASKQQLLAERARLQTMYRKAEQRSGSHLQTRLEGSARRRGTEHGPQREAEQIAGQLAKVEAELQRRDQAGSPSPGVAEEAPPA
jgi:hypothetical protein